MDVTKTLNVIAGKFVVLESDIRIYKDRCKKLEYEVHKLKEIQLNKEGEYNDK